MQWCLGPTVRTDCVSEYTDKYMNGEREKGREAIPMFEKNILEMGERVRVQE